MLYKTLALAVLLINETQAGGKPANKYDPRVIWFRYAVPIGTSAYKPGGESKDCYTAKFSGMTEAAEICHEDQYGRSTLQCGVNVSPNAIRKCYYTDCFRSLHKYGTRRRAAGGFPIHEAVMDGPKTVTDGDETISFPGCGNVAGLSTQPPAARRRLGVGKYGRALATQCRSQTCQTVPTIKQFRYWRKGAASIQGLRTGPEPAAGQPDTRGATYADCPVGNFLPDNTKDGKPQNNNQVKPEHHWQWYGTQQGLATATEDESRRRMAEAASAPTAPTGQKNCIYAAPPADCHCKTLVCKVSTAEEGQKTTAREGLNVDNWSEGKQSSDECNFIIRIEDFWPSPTVSKYMMWWMFSISAFIALALTAYYYFTYGAELVKGHSEGGSQGSGN